MEIKLARKDISIKIMKENTYIISYIFFCIITSITLFQSVFPSKLKEAGIKEPVHKKEENIRKKINHGMQRGSSPLPPTIKLDSPSGLRKDHVPSNKFQCVN